MKSLLRVHRYLGLFCAPMLILFAVSGSWQLVNAHKRMKNSSYVPPAAVKAVSDMHMGEDLAGGWKWAYRGLAWAIAGSLVTSAVIGISVAFRTSRGSRAVWLTLAAGTLLPLLLYLAARE